MLQVQVVSKEHHNVLENVQTNQVTLNEASVVVIHTTRENIQSAERVGNSLIIKTKDGQQLVIENYFSENPDLNDVVLEDNNKLYILETGDNAVGFLEINYNPIEEINPLLYSDTTAGLWAWLIPIATAGGILGWANNDSDSSSSPNNSSQLLDAAEKAVKAAEDANKAAKDALTDAQADGLITPEEKAKLEQALADAKAAEDTAQKAVDALKDGTDKDGLQDRLDNLTDIEIPAVTDTDGNGIDDAVDAQIADAEAAVKAAEDAYQAAEDALEEANANGLITPTEKAALEEALQAAQDAKDAAQDAVDALPSAPAAVQDAKDGFQDRIDALTDITIPAVNDANENGVDDSTENPVDLATDLVEAAEDAYQAAEDALTDANADGLITPEEKAALEDALKDAQDAKDAAQNAVDALPDSADKDALQDRIDALTDITVPAVTDTDGNGIDDAVDAQIADAEAAVKAAEDAYQAAEDALEEANANGLITPTEKAALEEALKAAQDAKDAAQDAVDALPSAPAAVQDAKDGFQDRLDALTDITIPAVNDANENGVDDSTENPVDLATDLVEAAEDAYQAAEDALTDANTDGLITPEEQAALEDALKDAQDAKDAAQNAVDALPDSADKDALQDRIDALTDITVPAVTDTDGNGIDDAVDAQIADAEAAVKAAEDAYQAAEDALEEANANGLITPTEKAALEEALKAAQDAKDAAQDAVDALPSAPAAVQDAKDGFQDRLDALTDITIPAVNDANENGVDDSTENPVDLATDLVEAAEAAYTAAEQALADALSDEAVTQDEVDALTAARDAAQEAKADAQAAVDGIVADYPVQAAGFQDRLDALTDIEIPAVNDANENGIPDDIQDVADLVTAAEAAYTAAEQALADALSDEAVTQDEVDALTAARDAAQEAKADAQAAVDGIVADYPVQAAGFQDRLDALTDIEIPAVNDANENGIPDDIQDVADLVTAAEAAYTAAEQALADALSDEAVTQDEVDALTAARDAAQEAKADAQAAVDGIVADYPVQAAGFQDRLDALTDIEIPAVNDANENGIPDDIQDVADLVTAAEAAYTAAEQALADALSDEAVTQDEVDALTAARDAAQEAKADAQAAVDGIVADYPVQAAGFQDRLDALTDIEIPAVNDANENGIPDDIQDVADLVTAAEAAYTAAEQALADALSDEAVTQDEVDALTAARDAAQEAKADAQAAVDGIVADYPVQAAGFQDRLDALTDIEIPAVNDANENGIPDDIQDVADLVTAAEAAYTAAEQALADALSDEAVTQDEVDALTAARDAAQEAKADAQAAVDGIVADYPVQAAGFQDRLDALTDIEIPAVNDANENGIPDDIQDVADLVTAAEAAYTAAEQALADALSDEAVTQDEVDALTAARDAAQEAKADAQAAVDGIVADYPVQAAGFQDRLDALTDIEIPAVNDANENGIPDDIQDVADLVTAAEAAYTAAEQALADALSDEAVTQDEVDALTAARDAAQEAKADAQAAVDGIVADYPVQAAGFQDRLDALTDIEIPAVNDANENGIPDDIQDVADLVTAAEAAYTAAEQALADALSDEAVTQDEVDALTAARDAAQEAKADAQAAVDGIVADYPVQAAGFQDRLDALTDIEIPAVNDANENGIPDDIQDVADLVTAAEAAYTAAEQALADALSDEAVTQDEVDALTAARDAAQEAKADAQAAVDGIVADYPVQAAGFQDRLDALTDIEIPAVNDANENGIPDDIQDVADLVTAAEAAYTAAEQALADALSDEAVTQDEVDALTAARDAAQEAKADAQAAVDGIVADYPVQAAGFQDRLDALTDIEIPAVNDANENGIPDDIQDVADLVTAAEAAYTAAEQALADALSDEAVTQDEVDALTAARDAAQEAKADAQAAVDGIVADYPVQAAGFQDRLDALTDIEIPAVNDANENGIPDDIQDVADLVTAAEAAYTAAEQALADALSDEAVTQDEVDALTAARDAAQEAKADAQAAVDGIVADYPVQAAGFQDRLDALTDIEIPAVNDANENGIPDDIQDVADLVTAAEAAYTAAEQALADALSDEAVTQDEVDALTAARDAAQEAKADAQAAVDGIVADYPVQAAGFQDRLDALTDIEIPAVNDANENGIPDDIQDVADLVTAAEAAYTAAEQALADALSDEAVTQDEVDALTAARDAAQEAKADAQAAVDGIVADYPVQAAGFQDRLDALTDIEIPAVNDANENGIPDDIQDVADLVTAAEAAYTAAEQALADALSDEAVTQDEVDALTAARDAAQEAKADAQAAVDGIVADYPVQAAGFQDRLDALTDIEIPPVKIALDDNVNLDMGNEITTTEPAFVDENVQVINLLESTGGADAGTEVVLSGSTNSLAISISQTSLLAVADAYRVDVLDENGNIVYSAVTQDSELVGDLAGLGILGITGDNTLTATVSDLPAGTYRVVVSNDAGALTNLLDTDGGGISLQELGDAGVLLGADNQQVVLDAVNNALGGGAIAALVTEVILPPVLTLVNGLPVDELVGALNDSLLSNADAISLLGFSVTGLLDTIVDAAATALLSNTLTLLQETSITTQVTSTTFENYSVDNNVLTNDENPELATVTHIQFGDGAPQEVTTGGVSINGEYGVLTIFADGSYEYIGNGDFESIGKSEVFTYTILGADGVTTDSATLTINILDDYAPDAPVINPVSATGDITGTAEAGSTVVVTDENNNEIGRTVVRADGLWSITNPGLTDGAVLNVIAIDAAGNPSQAASTSIDAQAPITTLVTNTTGDSTPTLQGTIDDPTATVVVTFDGIDYEALNNGDGTWTLADGKLPELADGNYNVTVKAMDTAGNESTITQSLVVEAVLFANDDLNTVNVLDTVVEDNLNGINGYTFGLLSTDVLSGVVDVNIGTNGFKFTVKGDTTQDISVDVSGTTGLDVSIGSVTYANLLLINIDTGEIVATAQNALKLEPWLLTTRLVANKVEFTNIPEGNYTIGFSSTSIDGFLNSLLEGIADLNLLSGSKININDSTQYSTADATGNVLLNGSSTDVADIGDGIKVTAVISAETTYAMNTPIATDNTETAIAGNYGILYMQADGSYRYVSNGNINDVGKVDTFTYTVADAAGNTSQAYLNIRTDAEGSTIDWDENDLQADGVITVDAVDDDATVKIAQTNSVSELLPKVQVVDAQATGTNGPITGSVVTNTTWTNTYTLSESFNITENTVANGTLTITAELLGTVLNTSVTEDWGEVTATYTIIGQSGEVTTGILTLTDSTQVVDGYYTASIPLNDLIAGEYILNVNVKNTTNTGYNTKYPSAGNTQTLINAAAALHSNNGEFTVDTTLSVIETSLNDFTTIEGIYSEEGNLLEEDIVSNVATFTIQQGAETYRFENGHIYQNDVLLQNQDSVDINGLYGTLNVKANSDYTYTAMNSEIGKTESFAYTVSDTGGFTDTANLNIGIGASITSSAYDDSYSTYAGISDTVIFNLLSDDNTGGNGHDTWSNFSVTEDDRIDVNALLQDGLSNLATDSDYIGNYIKVNTSGNDTVISIDRDGSATDSTYTETELLTLKNVNTTLQELLDNNQLLF